MLLLNQQKQPLLTSKQAGSDGEGKVLLELSKGCAVLQDLVVTGKFVCLAGGTTLGKPLLSRLLRHPSTSTDHPSDHFGSPCQRLDLMPAKHGPQAAHLLSADHPPAGSSEALLSGQRPPFALWCCVATGDGQAHSKIASAVSEGFVVSQGAGCGCHARTDGAASCAVERRSRRGKRP
jgi:hypothetical protein